MPAVLPWPGGMGVWRATHTDRGPSGISCSAAYPARPAGRSGQRHAPGDRVSPRPDAGGQQYVTIAGIITGPTVNEYAVYQRMAVDVDQWPTVGQILPVVYSPKNPDNWTFTPNGPPVG